MEKDSSCEGTKIIHVIQKKIQYVKGECYSRGNEMNKDTQQICFFKMCVCWYGPFHYSNLMFQG